MRITDANGREWEATRLIGKAQTFEDLRQQLAASSGGTGEYFDAGVVTIEFTQTPRAPEAQK